MTKVKFFLGDDTEPFIVRPPEKNIKRKTDEDNKKIVKQRRKQRTCFNILICFYGIFKLN